MTRLAHDPTLMSSMGIWQQLMEAPITRATTSKQPVTKTFFGESVPMPPLNRLLPRASQPQQVIGLSRRGTLVPGADSKVLRSRWKIRTRPPGTVSTSSLGSNP